MCNTILFRTEPNFTNHRNQVLELDETKLDITEGSSRYYGAQGTERGDDVMLSHRTNEVVTPVCVCVCRRSCGHRARSAQPGAARHLLLVGGETAAPEPWRVSIASGGQHHNHIRTLVIQAVLIRDLARICARTAGKPPLPPPHTHTHTHTQEQACANHACASAGTPPPPRVPLLPQGAWYDIMTMPAPRGRTWPPRARATVPAQGNAGVSRSSVHSANAAAHGPYLRVLFGTLAEPAGRRDHAQCGIAPVSAAGLP